MFWIFGLIVPIAALWFFGRLFSHRKHSFSTQLATLLDLCTSEGIISLDQSGRIIARSKSIRQGIQLRGTTWIAILAGLFVTAGISLIIAHNWDQIGPIVRVSFFLFLFGVLGEIAIRLEHRKVPWSLPFSLLWFFFPILGIGLFAQTFQISGDPIRPFFVWMLLTLPLVWVSQRKILPIPHLLLILGVLFCGSFTLDNSFSLVGVYHEVPPFSIWAWVSAFFLMGLALVESFKLLAHEYRRHIFGAVLLYLTLLVFMPTSLKVENGGWLFVAATSASTLCLALHLLLRSSLSERVPSYLFVVGCVYAMTFLWHVRYPFRGDTSPYGLLLVCGMAATATAILLVFSRDRFSTQRQWNYFYQTVCLGPLVLSFFLPHIDIAGIKVVAIFANLFLFIGALGTMWDGANTGSNLKINLGVAILTLVLVTRFVDVIGDFVQGGIGFIVSGIFLGLVAYALGKTRKHLMNRSGIEGLK